MKKIVNIVLILSMIMTFEFVSFGNDNSDDIKSILERGGRITLENDYVLKGKAEINKDTIIDLNGHIISCTNSDALVLKEGELYIEDTSGKKPSKTSEGLNVVVDGGQCCIYNGQFGVVEVNYGKCFIKDGIFVGERNYIDEDKYDYAKIANLDPLDIAEGYISLFVSSGECYVYGGTFLGEALCEGTMRIKSEDSDYVLDEGYLTIYDAVIHGAVKLKKWGHLWIYDGDYFGENDGSLGGYSRALAVYGGTATVYGGDFSSYYPGGKYEEMGNGAFINLGKDYESEVKLYGGTYRGGINPDPEEWKNGMFIPKLSAISIYNCDYDSVSSVFSNDCKYIHGSVTGKGSPLSAMKYYDEEEKIFKESKDTYIVNTYPNEITIIPSDIILNEANRKRVAMPELPKADTENNTQQIENFKTVNTYTEGQFIDVNTSDWSCKNIAKSYELGLMKGNSANSFNPKGNVTIAEAVTMAARLNSIYNTGEESFIQSGKWYQTYVDYAKEHGIVEKEYDDYQKAITREEFASILASAFPDEALAEMNSVSENSIPDISDNSEYKNSIYKLYRAGILTGNDSQGTFTPKSSITREAASAIITRMACPELRQSIKL